MGNKSSRHNSSYLPESGPSPHVAYLNDVGGNRRQSAPTRTDANNESVDGIDSEVVEMLKSENMLGIADRLSRFSTRLYAGVGRSLTVDALATFDRDDFNGSGLTPLQRRRLVRAAARASKKPARRHSAQDARDGMGSRVKDIGLPFPHFDRRFSSAVDAPLQARKFSTPVDASIDEQEPEEEPDGDQVDYMVARLPVSPPSCAKLEPGYLEIASPTRPLVLPAGDGDYVEFTDRQKPSDIFENCADERYLKTEPAEPENSPYERLVTASLEGKQVANQQDLSGNCPPLPPVKPTMNGSLSPPPPLPPKRSSGSSPLSSPRFPVDFQSSESSVFSSPGVQKASDAEKNPQKKTFLVEKRGSRYSPVHFVLNTMIENINDPDVQFSTCSTLAGLAKQRFQNAQAAYDENAVAIVTEILLRHSSVEKLVEQAFRVLAQICLTVPAAVADIVSDGGIEGIINLLALHQSSELVQRAGCKLMFSLAYQDLNARKVLIKFGAIDSVLHLMESFPEDPLTLLLAYAVIACLAAQTYNAKVTLVEKNALLAVAVGMNAHLSHATLQLYGCAAIANVTFGNAHTAEKAVEDGILQLVIGVVKQHKKKSRVLLYAMKALGSLIHATDAWSYVFDSGIVSGIMETCSANSAESDLHLWSCYVLSFIAANGGGKVRNELMNVSIVDWCLQLMGYHNEETEAHAAANTLLHAFPPYNLFSIKRSASISDL